MPELAEVEAVRQQIEKHLKGHRVSAVEIDEADRILFQFAKAKKVREALKGARIKGTGRKGKYFWLELDRKPWPVIHLGMTGNVALLDPKAKNTGHQKIWGGAKLWSERDADLREKLFFCRLLLRFDKGIELALIDPRRFGRIWLADDPWEFSRIKRLGYDPLLDFPLPAVLVERLKKRKKAIKSVLLDQALFAGIGNWLADEILYQAKLNPHQLSSELSPTQVKSLHKQILLVTKKAVAVGADYERFPKTWLFHDRWGKGKRAKTTSAASKKSKSASSAQAKKSLHPSKAKPKQTTRHIQFDEIGGRTTAWVPAVQK